MISKIHKQEHKRFLIKSYKYLWQLEEAIKGIRQITTKQPQLSVLGKFGEDCIADDKGIINSKKEMKRYWKGSLGANSHFGLFCNPEIGTLFIAGALVSQFLNDMDGKALGAITSGPYGILRGLGIKEKKATSYLKSLNNGDFLILIRGYDYELDKMTTLFESRR